MSLTNASLLSVLFLYQAESRIVLISCLGRSHFDEYEENFTSCKVVEICGGGESWAKSDIFVVWEDRAVGMTFLLGYYRYPE